MKSPREDIAVLAGSSVFTKGIPSEKLHLIINDKGELLYFVITQANVDDRQPLIVGKMLNHIWGKLFGDKGCISQSLFNTLFVSGIHLTTKIRKNMKNTPMNMSDKILLRKRALIESVNDELKYICQIEHTRHRNFANFLANLIAGFTFIARMT